MNGRKGDPHAKEQLSLWLIIGIHKPIPIARAPVSRWWNRWLRDLEASLHCSFVWSIPTTSVISPLIITLPAVEFPWEGMGQCLYARGLHSVKILAHHNRLFCEKSPASNSGNRSPGCEMRCYFEFLPHTPVVFIYFPLGRIKLLWVIGFLECHTGEDARRLGRQRRGVLWPVTWSSVASRSDGSPRRSSTWSLSAGSSPGLGPRWLRWPQLCLPDNKCLVRWWRGTRVPEPSRNEHSKSSVSKELGRTRCSHLEDWAARTVSTSCWI